MANAIKLAASNGLSNTQANGKFEEDDHSKVDNASRPTTMCSLNYSALLNNHMKKSDGCQDHKNGLNRRMTSKSSDSEDSGTPTSRTDL